MIKKYLTRKLLEFTIRRIFAILPDVSKQVLDSIKSNENKVVNDLCDKIEALISKYLTDSKPKNKKS